MSSAQLLLEVGSVVDMCMCAASICNFAFTMLAVRRRLLILFSMMIGPSILIIFHVVSNLLFIGYLPCKSCPHSVRFFLWCPTKGFTAIRIKVCLCSYPEPKQCQPSRPAQGLGVGKQSHYRTSSFLCPKSTRVITHANLKGTSKHILLQS